MYKRLYLNQPVPPDRKSYNLVTHDIEGANPKHWVHPQRPFFAPNDPETHLAIQNDQYNAAMKEHLHYTQKERDPEWKYSKKCDYNDSKAKISLIGQQQLINRKEEYDEVKQVKQVFYPRNLNTKDIEGTDCGSLDTKFMKNWKLAQEFKSNPALHKPQKPNLTFPYGDGINTEEYLPEHLRKAREVAGVNRHRMKLIHSVEGGLGNVPGTGKGEPTRRQANLERNYLGDGPNQAGAASDGNIFQKNSSNAPPILPTYHKPNTDYYPTQESSYGNNEYKSGLDPDREAEIRRRVEEMMALEEMKRQRETYAPPQQQQENFPDQSKPFGHPQPRVRFEDTEGSYNQYQSGQNQFQQPQSRTVPANNFPQVKPHQEDQYDRLPYDRRVPNPQNTNMVVRSRSGSPDDLQKMENGQPPVAMAPFLRGQKGKEFTLEAPKGERLQHLNEFYTDFVGEQYKRRVPFTKDEYNYQKVVSHLKRNGIL